MNDSLTTNGGRHGGERTRRQKQGRPARQTANENCTYTPPSFEVEDRSSAFTAMEVSAAIPLARAAPAAPWRRATAMC